MVETSSIFPCRDDQLGELSLVFMYTFFLSEISILGADLSRKDPERHCHCSYTCSPGWTPHMYNFFTLGISLKTDEVHYSSLCFGVFFHG